MAHRDVAQGFVAIFWVMLRKTQAPAADCVAPLGLWMDIGFVYPGLRELRSLRPGLTKVAPLGQRASDVASSTKQHLSTHQSWFAPRPTATPPLRIRGCRCAQEPATLGHPFGMRTID